MVTSREKDAGQYRNIKAGNKSFEILAKFKHYGRKITNQSSINEEIKSRLKSGNACYHLAQNLLFSLLNLIT
jgi:hypothetical protein